MTASRYLTLLGTSTITTAENGTYSSASTVPPHVKKFAVERAVTSITGTSPTLDITVQHSFDGTTWYTLLALTQIVTGSANATTVQFLGTSTDYLKPLGNFVRLAYTVGGTNSPTFNGLAVRFWYE